MTQQRNDQRLTVTVVTAALTVVLAVPEAQAQTYYTYPTQQTYYQQQTYPQPYAQAYTPTSTGQSNGYHFSRLPFVGRNLVGYGLSHGRESGRGFSAESALSFRLQSDATYSGGHVLIIPELGIMYLIHEEETDEEPGWNRPPDDDREYLLGSAGLRLGWGRPRIGNLYLLGRVLAGSRDSDREGYGFALGTQLGVGGELWHGVFGVEVSHVWLYSPGEGNLHSIRASANVDVLRGLITVFGILLHSGSTSWITGEGCGC